MTPKDHLFDQLKKAGRSIMEGQQTSVPSLDGEVAAKTGPAPQLEDRPPTTEDQLFFLIREAGDRILEFKQVKLRELGVPDLTVDMFRYVEVIDSLDGPNASAIAGALNVTRPSVTAILNKLERKGILHKRKDRKDGRAVRIELTTSGRSIAAAYREAHREFARAISARLEPEEFETLVRLMARGMDGNSVHPE